MERQQQKGLTAWGWVLRIGGFSVWLWGGVVTPIQNGRAPDFGTLLVAVVLAILPNASRLADRLMSQLPSRDREDPPSS